MTKIPICVDLYNCLRICWTCSRLEAVGVPLTHQSSCSSRSVWLAFLEVESPHSITSRLSSSAVVISDSLEIMFTITFFCPR